MSSRVVVCGQVSQRRSSNAITFKSGSLASDGRQAGLAKKICLIGSDGQPRKGRFISGEVLETICMVHISNRRTNGPQRLGVHTFTPRLFGAWDGTTVKDARGGRVEVRVRFQVHRRARSVSDIPRALSATARRSRCIVRIGIGGIFARIDSIRSGGGRGGRIEGGAGGRRSRRERCTRDMCTPRPRTGCTTRIPPRWPCARRFRVTASAAGRRTTAA